MELLFDLILRGGWIIDGTGSPAFRADMGVSSGRIAALGRLDGAEAEDVLDVTGLVICPGFIDPHCHSDALPFATDPLPAKILQGVTTEVNGNCGSTAFPLSDRSRTAMRQQSDGIFEPMPWDWSDLEGYAASLSAAGPVSNIAPLVGHHAIRAAVLGFDDRAPSAEELTAMRRLLATALEQGAVGFSSGLVYPPGLFSETAELVALAAELRPAGRPYVSHIRGEASTLFAAVAEALEIGSRNGIAVQVSHLKAAGKANHGRAGALLEALERARREGINVTADAYPYPASSTSLSSKLPPWVQDGGREALLRRLDQPDCRERLKRDFADGLPGWDSTAHTAGWDGVIVSGARNATLLGRSIAELAEERGADPVDAVCDVLLEERGQTTIVIRLMTEEDVRAILAHPLVMIGSDAIIARGKPHPRTWGTYPRVLGHYARDVGLFSQVEAVRKMTSMVAAKFGLWDRGLVRPGLAADLVTFDPSIVADRATYEDPEQSPAGIPHVLVNGVVAVRNGRYTGARAGEVLLAR